MDFSKLCGGLVPRAAAAGRATASWWASSSRTRSTSRARRGPPAATASRCSSTRCRPTTTSTSPAATSRSSASAAPGRSWPRRPGAARTASTRDIAEADTFEVWADVARHYALDPDWTVVSGYSMGGIGTYRLMTRWPDLFARGMSTVGFPDESARLPSLRNTPIMTWAASADELVNIAFTEQAVSDLVEPRPALRRRPVHGGRPPHAGHQRRVRAGCRVPRRAPRGPQPAPRDLRGRPRQRLRARPAVADHAYWLSDLRIRDAEASPRGTIDARSRGLRRRRSRAVSAWRAATARSRAAPAARCPTSAASRTGGPRRPRPKADRLVVEATNIASATVDARRARLELQPQPRREERRPARPARGLRSAAGELRAAASTRAAARSRRARGARHGLLPRPGPHARPRPQPPPRHGSGDRLAGGSSCASGSRPAGARGRARSRCCEATAPAAELC